MYRCSANNATTIMRRMKSICGKSHADAETSRSRKFHTGKGETRIREETGCDSERERYTKIWRNKEEEGANWPYTPTETRTCVRVCLVERYTGEICCCCCCSGLLPFSFSIDPLLSLSMSFSSTDRRRIEALCCLDLSYKVASTS